MPSYAQDFSNLAGAYAYPANVGNGQFLSPDMFAPYYASPFMASGGYGIPFISPSPFFGQAYDLRSLYGPAPQLAYNPYSSEAPLASTPESPSQPQVEGPQQDQNPAMGVADAPIQAPRQPDLLPSGMPRPGSPLSASSMLGPSALMSPSVSTPPITQAGAGTLPNNSVSDSALQPSSTASLADVQGSSQQSSQGSAHPSIQVVVQPSQPFAPVQAQKPQTTPQPSTPISMQSQMPTNVMQPVPYSPVPFSSGPLIPQQSGSFFLDECSEYDPYLATGGRVAGATFLGILSIPFSLIAPLGLLFSLVGLHLANSYINNGGGRGIGNFARFFNIVGLLLTIAIVAIVVLYIGYSAGQDGFQLFGQDPIAFINNSEPMQFIYEQWNKLQELWPW